MKTKLAPRPSHSPAILLKNDGLKDSFAVCVVVVDELLTKIIKQLPPDQEVLLQYSGLVIKNTTEKLVDVTMLKSQNVYCCQSDRQELPESQAEGRNQQLQPQLQTHIQKKTHSVPAQHDNNDSASPKVVRNQLSKSGIRHFKIKKPFKLNEDQEIHINKDGIKLLKRQQLKNLINQRASYSRNSLHEWFSNPNAKQGAKNGFHQNLPHYQNQHPTKHRTAHIQSIIHTQMPNQMPNNKSTKSISTLPGIQKANWSSKPTYDKQRISAVLNTAQLVNLKDYYREKGDRNSTLVRNTNNTNQSINNSNNPTQKKSRPSNNSAAIQQNSISESFWQTQKQGKKIDQADAVINKLRERKQKFYRTGINYSNGESYVNTKRSNTLAMNQGQKGANNQVGAMVTFDYSGEIMPTFKYDTIKMQPHFQEMQFTVGEDDESFSKKKERKVHVFRAAINLKLVDHQKFIPHPQYKYEPLVEKVGMLMKENTAYSLKKGVELKVKEDNAIGQGNSAPQSQENRERLNRAAFQFLYNEEIGDSKIKYQDFIRYKKLSKQPTSTNKNPSSRKKIDPKQQSILSKHSIAFKAWKGKQSKQSDVNNKVYRSQNRKALQLLVNGVLNTQCELGSVNENGEEEKENVVSNGILNKKGNYVNNKSESNGAGYQKKKVRIA